MQISMQGVIGGLPREIEMAKPELTKAGKDMSVLHSVSLFYW